MREINEEDAVILNKKLGMLYMTLRQRGPINVNGLVKTVEEIFPTSEDKTFCLSLLVADRFIKITDKIINERNNEIINNNAMFG